MFSGGYDSMLAAAVLVEKGYETYLLTLDNGMYKGLDFATSQAERLRKKYGEKIKFLGTESFLGIWRKFLIPYMRKKEVFTKYKLLPKEFFCLTCMSSMYIFSIIKCKLLNIPTLASGARISYRFPDQTKNIIERYRKLCKEYDVKLLLPIFRITSKEKVKEELIRRDIIPKVIEPFCALSMPYPIRRNSSNLIESIEKIFDEFIFPNAEKIINKFLRINNSKINGNWV